MHKFSNRIGDKFKLAFINRALWPRNGRQVTVQRIS